jgi:hypothetical protein
MTVPGKHAKRPDIIASKKALRRAARRALQLGFQTGTPVYVDIASHLTAAFRFNPDSYFYGTSRFSSSVQLRAMLILRLSDSLACPGCAITTGLTF